MGFYNSKLENYSKELSFTTEQLDYTKARIIEQKKNDIEMLRKDMQLSRRAGLDGDFEYEEQQESLFLAMKELEFISTMDTPSFYQYLISLENFELCRIEDKAFDNMANNIKDISKYKSQKGLLGKTSALLGLDKKMIAKKGKMLDDNNLSADFAQSSKSEWQSIAPENQALYIVGRYEIDKTASFDRENYEKYKVENFAKAEAEAENGYEIEM